MGWPLVTNQLHKSGLPFRKRFPPRAPPGGSTTDDYPIEHNKDLAYQLLNYLISAQAQKQLSDVTVYIPANPQAAALMTPEQRHNLHLDDIDAYQHQIVFWQDVPRRAKYTEIGNEVKASQ